MNHDHDSVPEVSSGADVAAVAEASAEAPAHARRILRWMTALTVVIVLAGAVDTLPSAWLRVEALDILRRRELLSMFLLAPAALFCMWRLLLACAERPGPGLMAGFLLGIYLIGMGFGMHEAFNIYVGRYYREMTLPMVRSAMFFDDRLSHWIFFAGFIVLSLTGAVAELRHPWPGPLSGKNLAHALVLGVVAAVTAAVAVGFQKNLPDLIALFAAVALLAGAHLIHGSVSLRRLPILLTMYLAYGGGAIAIVVARLAKA